jgi:uncharacterized membrane-anchored protein
MRLKFIVIVLLQVVLLVGMIGYRQHWLSSGEKILLRTVPVDPRDIFRGDYVNLNYEISTLAPAVLSPGEKFPPNEIIYVLLEKDADGTCRAISAAKTPPSGKLFIQGRVRYESLVTRWEVSVKDDEGIVRNITPRFFDGFSKDDRIVLCLDQQDNVISQHKEDAGYSPECPGNRNVHGTITEIRSTQARQLNVEYGIESYFVEEGQGRAIETARNARDLKVEVSLRKDGKAIIARLVLDGKGVR